MLPAPFTIEETKLILYVKSKIKDKMQDFELTIGKLGKTYPDCYFVSGGCTASLLNGETPNDYDVYLRDKTSADNIISLYKLESYKSEVATYEDKYREVAAFVDGAAEKLLITENAMTLKNGIQVIIKHYGEPAQVRKTFDYVHCLPYYDSKTDKFHISREQYDCCIKKILKPNNNNPTSSSRLNKFIMRGYK